MNSTALTMEAAGGSGVSTALSRLIERVMADTGRSQSDIARRAGLSPQAVSGYLRDIPLSRLEQDTIVKLAKGLGVEPWTVIRAVSEDMGFSDADTGTDAADPTIKQIETLSRSLPPQERRRVLRVLRGFLDDEA